MRQLWTVQSSVSSQQFVARSHVKTAAQLLGKSASWMKTDTPPAARLLQVQPVDAVVLAAVKSRGDVYHSVVSTSPLLYLTHPTSQPLKRPLGVTLPCPPNPEKKRDTRGQREGTEQSHSCCVSPPQDPPASHRPRYNEASFLEVL